MPRARLAIFSSLALAATALQAAPGAAEPLTGHWSVAGEYLGARVYLALELKQEGEKLTGNFDGDALEGTAIKNAVTFLAKDENGGTENATATLRGDTLSGTIVFRESMNVAHPIAMPFTAHLPEQRRPGAPVRFEFVPKTFSRHFSSENAPVLTVFPGDTIHTTTVDAGGADETGTPRVLGGNPQTGPFYVSTALPGDTLVVHLLHLRLNRDWALSDDAVVERGLNSELAVKMKDGGKPIRWHLDTQRGVAMPEKPGEHLARYTVPLKPMLGCIATAPGNAQAMPLAGDSGGWGGNMDFNEIVEGATVYLPVNVPGALLYFGDGHAAQGDGETTGNALETSMDVELSVDVLPGKRILGPRVESSERVMAMGLSGSLDDAFRDATSNMSDWLMSDYKLTPSEVAQVLGSAAEYKVSEVADRNAGVVLKLSKERLQALLPPH